MLKYPFNYVNNVNIIEETEEYTLYKVEYTECRYGIVDWDCQEFKIEKRVNQ